MDVPIKLKIAKKEITFKLAFNKTFWVIRNIETNGIVLEGYFEKDKAYTYPDFDKSITYFKDALEKEAKKVIKREFSNL